MRKWKRREEGERRDRDKEGKVVVVAERRYGCEGTHERRVKTTVCSVSMVKTGEVM